MKSMSGRCFENEPKKVPKDRVFFGLRSSTITLTDKVKKKSRKGKSNGCTLSFYHGRKLVNGRGLNTQLDTKGKV